MSQGKSGFFAGLWFMPDPADRLPMTPARAAQSLGPAYLCAYVMALLVLKPNTRVVRLALLPVALYTAFRAATTYDHSSGDPTQAFQNFGQCLSMLMIAMRLIEWAVLASPLQRTQPSTSVFLDAADLLTNYRGIGWEWSKDTPFPPETRPTDSKLAFTLATVLRLAQRIFLYDALHTLMRRLAPPAVGTAAGGSIFDDTLPPSQRYARSTLVTALFGCTTWLSMDLTYDAGTALAMLVPGAYAPRAWPPYSRLPLRATSVSAFWGRHWHQTLRRTFTVLSRPLAAVLGRGGAVLGAFLLSGVLHDWCMWGMGKGTNFAQTGGFFLAMAAGVMLEEAWTKVTGRKVGGWAGWAWTMAWTVAWGNLLTDAWMKTGLGGGEILPPQLRPAQALLAWISK
ncbi:membrane bound O-acyl transferase family-domain-containing protein [Phanerochaete sordida]|uniref:Membrane bound O-acyl transferase family-domain-containing protein n=1 Tax=Phanerochaete sordida TaxID=48140 RepID=A0A9P3G5R1_9APHY|nr:membrane bound O-acyl transferase family-domain-containing protein [Phanerochaete sordida]